MDEVTAARDWFAAMGGQVVITTPGVTVTGAALEGPPGYSGSPVEITAKDYGYRVTVQLPSWKLDLSRVKITLRSNMQKMTVNGEMGGGQIIGPATTPIVISRRARVRRLYPPACFKISFDLPGPIALPLVSVHIEDNGVVELFLEKANVAVTPPPTQSGEEEEEATPPPPLPPPQSPSST